MATANTLLRQQRILTHIREHGEVTVSQLADVFNISSQTVRRDLRMLQKQNFIHRKKGRAIPNMALANALGSANSFNAAKDKIGRVAAETPKQDEIVFLGPGTTTFAVAYHLCSRSNLTVITSHPQHASLLMLHGQHEVWILGGRLEHSTGNILGGFAQKSLEHFRSSAGIIGCDGVNPRVGLVIKKAEHEAFASAIADSSHRLIVVADSTKFDFSASGFVIPMERVDLLITNSGINPDMLAEVRKSGVHIQTA